MKTDVIKEAIEKGVVIITGGPGTGKTTTINTIIKVFENNDQKVVLAAPTGRAAKRMSETSNKEAKTIHRLLEMGFGMDSDELTFMLMLLFLTRFQWLILCLCIACLEL